MYRKLLLICLTLILSGCVSAEILKRFPDKDLKFNSYSYGINLYRQEIVRRHPDWPERTKQAILKGSVLTGMTEEQARASWGETSKVNRTTTQYGVHEQWVYGLSSYLYFDDGILTSIQN
jgi:hypothetical protein